MPVEFSFPVEKNTILAPYTTYKIGGPADYFFVAHDRQQLVKAISEVRHANVPYFSLGTGANILVRDGGFRGLVILNRANRITITGTTVTAESGATIADLIELTATAGLSGLEHFAGIPSSVGGAMRQNLHFLAPDRKSTKFIEQVVESAEILDDDGNIRTVDREFFQFGYDDSILHHSQQIVLSVTFDLSKSDEAAIRRQMAENLTWRRAKQPQLDEFPSCGSVFKIIDGVGAGRLIDQCGLKGTRIGNAQISSKHANFIVNLGGATAKDVLALAKRAQDEVAAKTGYHLDMEIGLVGEA
jgi:UDP-N-acetylmuramate dehydrogenase